MSAKNLLVYLLTCYLPKIRISTSLGMGISIQVPIKGMLYFLSICLSFLSIDLSISVGMGRRYPCVEEEVCPVSRGHIPFQTAGCLHWRRNINKCQYSGLQRS